MSGEKFAGSLLGPGDYVANENSTTFDEFGVNLEENSNTTPVNYVIPPGIQRQLNLQSANLVQLNEGSLALNVCDLQDGDARAVSRNVQLDLRAYKTMNLFVHCQSGEPSSPLKYGDVTAFIRVGSDFTENYYEYEVPLAVTPQGNYNTSNNNDQTTVWPTDNTMTIQLATLENAKLSRDAAMESNHTITFQTPYTVKDGVNNVTVVGNPTISNTQIIMLGVRNPKRTVNTMSTDDGKPKCAQVWFDELRMTNFSEKGGVATVNRVTAKLADLGTLSLSGHASTPGFGTLEANVGSLSRETDLGYSVATNLEMGKFLPPSWNVSVPTYMSYSDQWILPEYNPLDPDILLSNTLSTLNKQGQDSIKSIVISRSIARSLNFTNVHKNKGKNQKKTHFWDIENFSGNYAFTEQNTHDVSYQSNLTKSYKGGLIYTFSFHPKPIEPFKKMDFFRKRKYLALITDFNFYPMIDKISVSNIFDREYSSFQLRNTIPGASDIFMPIAVNRAFNVVRTYNLTYSISKSLRVDFMATNDSRVDEPEGIPVNTTQQKDTVVRNFFEHQTNTDYKQTAGVNYDVPLKKIPFLDFITLTAHYASGYEWVHAPFGYDSLGATISNSNTKSINSTLNMTTLYDKVPFLKKMLKDENKGNKPPPANKPPLNRQNPASRAPAVQPEDTARSHDGIFYAEIYLAYLATSLKNVNFSFTQNKGTVLPGYNQTASILGMAPNDNWAPGPAFVFGSQTRIVQHMIQDSLLEKLVNDYTPISTINTQTINFRANFEPLPDLKIDITANRTQSQNASYYIDYITGPDNKPEYSLNSPNESGNFSMTYIFVESIFSGSNGSTSTSRVFQRFINDTYTISQIQGSKNPYSVYNPITGYASGYSIYSQNVAIPAFLAAYSAQNPKNVTLSPFPAIPLPNWSISYNVYKPIASIWPWVKKNITSITLSNAYTGTYSIGGFSYNLLFNSDANGNPVAKDLNGDFLPKDVIPTVAISDAFSPLIKIAVTFKGNISSNFEIRNDRQAALDMSDIEIAEVHGTEYILGLGYKIKQVRFPITIGGKAIKNDVTLRADLSLRSNETLIQNAINRSNQITGGQQIITIKTQAEYNINTRVTIRLFFDKIINNPFISSTFPTSTMDGGIAIRFSLS